MESPESIISSAFETLRLVIREEDAYDWASTAPKDVWNAVREIDALQRQRQSAQNLRRVEPLLRGLEKYAKVIEVLCNGTPYLPYVWAPIKLMVQLASDHRDIFEALLTAYAEIGAALPRFDRYEKAFRENPEFQRVLAAVYKNILEFHGRAYKFFRRKAWHLIFLSLWKDFQANFVGILEALKQQRDFVDREALSIDIIESRIHRTRLQEQIKQAQQQSALALEKDEKFAKVTQLRHAMEWLAIDAEEQEWNIERISRRRHNSTCQWISREPQMRAWLRNDSKYPIIWLNGKPGAGKSVMCSFIVQEILETRSKQLNFAYYFCDSHDGGNISSRVLKTIAIQLLKQNLDLASLICNEYLYSGLTSGTKELRSLMQQILQIVPSTKIVIDGLDECSYDGQKSVLKLLRGLCSEEQIDCKIMFSSRKEVHIGDKLSSKPQICLDWRVEVERDIRVYVKHKMTKLRTDDEKLLNRIESILVEKANGMFLWVRLVIEELRDIYNDADLEARARGLPRGLKQAYGRILDRILESNGKSDAIRILEWMVCSKRVLKSYEIIDGLGFKPGSTILDDKSRNRHQILDLCRPLIDDGPSNTIDFVHFSAKEYLLHDNHREGFPFLNVEIALFHVTFSCIAYLNTSLCLLPSITSQQDCTNILLCGFHGLQLYANQFWVSHILSYLQIISRRREPIPHALLFELETLLQFRKSTRECVELKGLDVHSLSLLDSIPQVKSLLIELNTFRVQLKEGKILKGQPKMDDDFFRQVSALDPTHFSAIRHSYRLALESLLAHEAPVNHVLKRFIETYGGSGFTCRFLHCPKATDGFNTSQQRASHEATHQRKFYCENQSCFKFGVGFTTRRAWAQHIEQYHREVTNTSSLLDRMRLEQRASVKKYKIGTRGDGRYAQVDHEQKTSVQERRTISESISSGPALDHIDNQTWPRPPPPSWLVISINNLRKEYPIHRFESAMKYDPVSAKNNSPVPYFKDQTEEVEFMYRPRIRCLDCPGKLFFPGPGNSVDDFLIHLKNRKHNDRVGRRIAAEKGDNVWISNSGIDSTRSAGILPAPKLRTEGLFDQPTVYGSLALATAQQYNSAESFGQSSPLPHPISNIDSSSNQTNGLNLASSLFPGPQGNVGTKQYENNFMSPPENYESQMSRPCSLTPLGECYTEMESSEEIRWDGRNEFARESEFKFDEQTPETRINSPSDRQKHPSDEILPTYNNSELDIDEPNTFSKAAAVKNRSYSIAKTLRHRPKIHKLRPDNVNVNDNQPPFLPQPGLVGPENPSKYVVPVDGLSHNNSQSLSPPKCKMCRNHHMKWERCFRPDANIQNNIEPPKCKLCRNHHMKLERCFGP